MRRGWTIIELMIVAAIIAILAAVAIPAILSKVRAAKKEQAEERTAAKPVPAKEVLPGDLTVVCLGGHVYYYSERSGVTRSRAIMAPKFDAEGKPSRCGAESKTQPKPDPKNTVR